MFASLNCFLTGGAAPVAATDPYFYDVSLLLTGDGTNGAQNNTFLDSSTNNFTITRNGNTTQGTFSPYGNLWSNYFDGSGDYLSATRNDSLAFGTGAFTTEFWIFPTAQDATNRNIVDNRIGENANAFTILINNGYPTVWTSSAVLTSSTIAPINTWSHVAVVGNGGANGSRNVKMYLNGALVGTWTTDYNFTVFNLVIGDYYGAPSIYEFAGYISNIRIVKGTALYTSNFTPSTTPLTAVSGTSLLTCQSNRFIDNSSNNFTLTVNGNTSVQRFSPFNPTAAYDAATIGGSGYFDGTGDYLAGGSNTAFNLTGDFDVEFWFYPNSSISTGLMALCGTNASAFYDYIILNNGNVEIYGSGGAMFIATFGSTIKQSSWNHFAFTRSGTTVRCFINGVLLGSNTTSSALNLSYGNGLTIGGIVSGSTTYMFNGYMSNFRIVKGTAVYTSNFTPPTAPVTAITNTSLLCNFTNAGIPDAAMVNDLETVGNAQVSTSVKKYGTGSLYFDGAGDWLKSQASVLNDFGAGNFTVEFWLYTTAFTNAYITLYDNNYSTAPNLTFQQASNGVMTVYMNGASVVLTSSTADTVGNWVHYAVVRNGTSVVLYRNGVSVASSTYSGNVGNATVPLYIGGSPNGGGTYNLNGYIDDLRITKGYARYTANFTPPTAAFPTY